MNSQAVAGARRESGLLNRMALCPPSPMYTRRTQLFWEQVVSGHWPMACASTKLQQIESSEGNSVLRNSAPAFLKLEE